MAGKKNLCAMIPAELHARIMAEKEEMKLGTLAEYVERIFAEHFEGGNDMQTERTLAVKISAELFDRLKEYRERLSQEELPAVRRLLEQDSKHLDRIQVLMASSREFYIIIRLRGEQESDVFSYLSRIEQNINDNGFTTRRATEQDLKKMLGVYFEQNVTTEKFEDFDGDRWVIVGE